MSHYGHDPASWYAVHCQPLKERLASVGLAAQLSLKVYLPQLKCLEGGGVRYRPFFPSYLFVEADLARVAVSQINATPGVVRLVVLGEAPQPLAASVIEALRLRLDQLNRQAGGPRFQPGSAVRLRSGPLQGLEAVFVEALSPSERARVLVEFLGRQRVLDVPAAALEPGGAPVARPARRTRGRGRPIRYV